MKFLVKQRKKNRKTRTSPLQEHKRSEVLKAVKCKIRILVRTKNLKCLSMTPRDEEKERNTTEVITYGCTVSLCTIVRVFKYTRERLVPAFKNCIAVEVQEGTRGKRNSGERSGEMTEQLSETP